MASSLPPQPQQPPPPTSTMRTKPKPIIAVCGLAIEASVFSPARSNEQSFHPFRGDDIFNKDPYNAFFKFDPSLLAAADWRGILTAHALPGGIVTRAAFDSLTAEIITGLENLLPDGAIEGLWFEIHGAMSAEGLEDAEAELLRRVRKVVGSGCLVSASMDLHGNVSREFLTMCDLCTTYRTAPHVDVAETRERAVRGLIGLVEERRKWWHEESKIKTNNEEQGDGNVAIIASSTSRPRWKRPFKAWIPIPILLPGEQTSTRMQPAKRIYEAIPLVEREEIEIIAADIWVGYAWADEPRCHAVVVVTGWDKASVSRGAEKLAKMFWNARAEFQFVAPTGSFADCLDTAFASKVQPYFVSDSGDNPTAGGAGDVTWGLTQLLLRPEVRDSSGPKVVYASIPGPQAVAVAVDAGIGADVTVTAGAEVDDLHAGPVTLSGRVHAIRHGDRHAETEVVIQVGSVFAIVTKKRKPYHKEHDFVDLDLDVRGGAYKVVVVKIGYLEPELFDMAKDWMLALTPGGVDQDLPRLGHKRIVKPMWPFDQDFEREPDLSARIVPSIDEE